MIWLETAVSPNEIHREVVGAAETLSTENADRRTKHPLQLLKETQLSALCLRGEIDKRKLYAPWDRLSSTDSSCSEEHCWPWQLPLACLLIMINLKPIGNNIRGGKQVEKKHDLLAVLTRRLHVSVLCGKEGLQLTISGTSVVRWKCATSFSAAYLCDRITNKTCLCLCTSSNSRWWTAFVTELQERSCQMKFWASAKTSVHCNKKGNPFKC